jgi:hypothetical protein
MLHNLVDVVSAMIVGAGLIDLSLVEVPPAEDLLSPQLEGGKKMKIATVGESKLLFAEAK